MPYYREPDEVTGYALDVYDAFAESFWQVCVPHATRNLILDPSFEKGVAGNDFTIVQQSMMGSYAAYTTNYVSRTFTPEMLVPHTVTAYVRLWEGQTKAQTVTMRVHLASDADNIVANRPYTVPADGRWHRLEVSFGPGHLLPYTLRVISGGVQIAVDCCQAEAFPYATTYVDGDLGVYPYLPFEEYFWEGEAHASVSVRTGRTRTGGRLTPLSDMGFRTMSFTGLGMPAVERTIVRASDGRNIVTRSVMAARELTIAGTIYGDTWAELNRRRDELLALFSPVRLWDDDDPILMRVQLDENEPALDLYVRYVDGLSAEVNNRHQQRMALRLQAIEEPFFAAEHKTLTLLHPQKHTNIDGLVKDLETGEWTPLYNTNPLGAPIYDLDLDDAGNIYAATAGDPARVLQKLSTDPLVDTGFGPTGGPADMPGQARVIAVDGAGASLKVAVAGPQMAHAVVDPIPPGVAIWNGTGWDNMGDGIVGGEVLDMLWHGGYVYVAGTFTGVKNQGGPTLPYAYLARYDPQTNTWFEPFNFTVGVGYYVSTLTVGPDNRIYFSGEWDKNNLFDKSHRFGVYDPVTGATTHVTPPYPHPDDGGPLYPQGGANQIFFSPSARLFALVDGGPTYLNSSMLLSPGKDAPGSYIEVDNGRSDWSWNEFGLLESDFSWGGFDAQGALYISGVFAYYDGIPSTTPYPLLARIFSRRGRVGAAIMDIYTSARTIESLPRGLPMIVKNNRIIMAVPAHYNNNTNTNPNYTFVGRPCIAVNNGSAPAAASVVVNGPCKLQGVWNWTTRRQVVMTTPVIVQDGERVALYEKGGVFWVRSLTQRDPISYPAPINPSGTDSMALMLEPGVNRVTLVTEPLTPDADVPTDNALLAWRTTEAWAK